MRILWMLALAAALSAPAALGEGFGLTDDLQDDPGTGGGDASEAFESPTFLDVAGVTSTGWLRGAVMPVDDPLDVYGYFSPSSQTVISFTVDPDCLLLDVAIVAVSPSNRSFFVDEQGAGGAESFHPPSGEEGLWRLAVLDRSGVGPVPLHVAHLHAPEDGHALSVRSLETYDMELACWPHC